MNSQILKAIQSAKDQALLSSFRHKHGAVVLKRGRIVGQGYNSVRTSWLQRIYARRVGMPLRVHEHAEFAAARNSTDEFDTLIVCRVSKRNDFLKSDPCPICRELIRDSGVKHLYYTDGSGIKYERL